LLYEDKDYIGYLFHLLLTHDSMDTLSLARDASLAL